MNDPNLKATVMVVDDQPANLKLLEQILRLSGHEVRSFPRGRLALAAAAQHPPDVILLDIDMPEMNGYEVCQRLKQDEKLRDVPVIFLSALAEAGDKVKAFQVGGVDYVCKPFKIPEVQARVDTHCQLHRLQQALQHQNECLEEVVRARTKELADAHARLKLLDRAKTDFLNLISHELRTPLNGVLGIGELLVEDSHDQELKELFDASRRRIIAVLDDALLLTEIQVDADRFRGVPVSVGAAIARVVEASAALAATRRVTVAAPIEDPGWTVGQQELMNRALYSLLETAIKFSTPGETVVVASSDDEERLTLTLDSHGRTIPEDAIDQFFDVFAIGETATPGGDLGLGPATASRILAVFGGSVRVENRQPPGIRLSVKLQRCTQ